jgi:MFS family permease
MPAGATEAVPARVRPGLAVAAALLLNPALGALYAWSVFVAPLEAALNAPRAEISLVFSIAVVAFTSGMLLAPQAYRLLPTPALLLSAVALVATGLAASAGAGTVWQLMLGYGLLFGFGSGAAYSITLQLINLALAHRRGLATGLGVGGFALGSILLAVLLDWTVGRFGLRLTFGGMGVGLAMLGLSAAALIGASRMALPDGKTATEAGRLKGRALVLLWLGFGCAAICGLASLGHAAGMVASYGGVGGLAVLGVVLMNACNALGRIAAGMLMDVIPATRVLAASHAIAASGFVLLLAAPGAASAVLAVALQGLAYGVASGGYPAAGAIFFGAANFGRFMGRLMTAWGVAGLGAPWLAGWLYDLSSGYALTAAFGLAASFAGAAMSLRIRAPQ